MITQAPTERQRLACRELQALGYTVENHERGGICMRRGNDYRVINQDGAQRRGLGARR